MHKGCSGRCQELLLITELWREGMREFAEGNSFRGEMLERKSLALLQALGGFPVIEARIRNNLGVILCCTGRKAEARWEFSQALTLLSGRVEPGSRFHQVLARNYGQTLARPSEGSAAGEPMRLAEAI